MLRNGLYEQVINKALEGELATTDKLVETAPIDGGESSKVLSKYIAEIIEKGLDNVRDSGGALADQVASYYQRDLRDRHFFPSEDWQSLPSDDDDLPTAPQSTIGGLLE